MTKFKTDKLNPCRCGFKPTEYHVHYGRTPYDVYCPDCKKQLSSAKCLVTSGPQNCIDYWNKHVSKKTVEELRKEVVKFQVEKQKNTGYDGYRYYDYYWYEDGGERLIKRC